MGISVEQLEDTIETYNTIFNTLNQKIRAMQEIMEQNDLYMKVCSKCGLKWEDRENTIQCPRCHPLAILPGTIDATKELKIDLQATWGKASPENTIQLVDQLPMTLERAVEVLNKQRHAGCGSFVSNHYIDREATISGAIASMDLDPRKHIYLSYSKFEAIAIAEKYEREGK